MSKNYAGVDVDVSRPDDLFLTELHRQTVISRLAPGDPTLWVCSPCKTPSPPAPPVCCHQTLQPMHCRLPCHVVHCRPVSKVLVSKVAFFVFSGSIDHRPASTCTPGREGSPLSSPGCSCWSVGVDGAALRVQGSRTSPLFFLAPPVAGTWGGGKFLKRAPEQHRPPLKLHWSG